ncbi:MAG: hypothetical protein FWD71_09530, partial [Oscillospiraceae bacterium]|nr:hypothetical protein [Oscillospiraceae bacterium]
TKVEDSMGNIILDNRIPKKTIIMSEENAFILTKLMMGVVYGPNGESDGEGKGTADYKTFTLRDKIDVAGKTGTTNSDNDRWFIGFTPYYLGGVWIGYDQPKSLNVSKTSANPPMLIFNTVMEKIHAAKNLITDPKQTFKQPATVILAPYRTVSGSTSMGYFAKGSEPDYQIQPSTENTTEPETETTAEATTENTTEPPTIATTTEPPTTEATQEQTIGDENSAPPIEPETNAQGGETSSPANNISDILNGIFTNNQNNANNADNPTVPEETIVPED